jgi:hypothetical protein
MRCTAYQLQCGYIDKIERGKLSVTLWREHSVYHVRAHEFDGRGRLAWKVFIRLKEARKAFTAMRKTY